FGQKIHTDQAAERLYSGAELVRESKHSDLPSFIRMKESDRIPVGILKAWMTENLELNSDIDFEVIRSEKDHLGFTHTRMRQTFKGIPIESAIWLSHAKENVVRSMNGMIFKNMTSSSYASISEFDALEKAKSFVGADEYKWDLPTEEAHLKWESDDPEATYFPTGELVFVARNFNFGTDNFRLAYKFDIYAQAPLYRANVYVDAITGEVIAEDGILHHADTPGTAETVYSGSQPIIGDSFGGQFRLRDGSRGLGIRTFDLNQAYGYGGAVDFTDADNDWNNVNPQQDEYAGDAHWGTERTYDYFNDIHGRNSIDDAGFQLNSYVHYGVNYVNAFWDGTRMTYGDGNGAPYTPLVSLDIAGHEITHGLTNLTANLIYYGESGALNESFSDIFGTAIENFARPGDWDWLLSADIGASFRSLENPNLFGHPDTYFGDNWASLVGADNGGVHSNSGVQNFWYYLLVSGGAGTNDNGDAYTVGALGFESASAIAFRNLTVYLTDGSDHPDARFFAIQSAIDLFGECSVEEKETTNAWYAVGVGPEYVSIVEGDFTATPGCFPDGEVDFTDASTTAAGVLDTWTWDFGDGGTSPDANPTHSFAGTGVYPVELTVTNDLGCEDIFLLDIEVFDAPLVDFTTVNLCEGDLTTFTDATTIPVGAIVTWAWDFGDAGTSPLTDPTYTYAIFGTYDVKLVATSDNGCVDSIITPITINPSPVADFSFDDGCVNIDAAFTNLSTSPDGAILTDFSWDFGDGTPADISEDPTHTYGAPGPYDVTLDVVSAEGCTSTITYTVNRFDVPVADFSFDNVCLGTDATFTDLSTILAPDVIATLDWEFGDGGVDAGADPTYTYAGDGTFDVTLTATSASGCEDVITIPITIYPNPEANFSALDVCVNGDPTMFNDMSTISGGAITDWSWDFGDGSSGAVADPIKNYTTPGTYDATLTITSDFGCEDVITIPVNVFEKPTANFTSDLTAICSPDCIEFSSLSVSATTGISNWEWIFESGDVAFEENPRICFSEVYTDQLYDLELIVTNDFGCKDTISVTDYVTVTASPIASFDCTPDVIDIFDPTIELTNNSENAYAFTWNFGDSSPFSNTSDPTHTYPEVPGSYTITLEAFSQNGLCSDIIQKIVTVNDVIIYYIPNTFTPDGDTFNETFSPVFRSGYDPYDFHLIIFNRWGEKVFETFDAFYGWDGTYGDLGLVESGVYIWALDFKETMTDKRHKAHGHVTVIK
ncbi:MAG: gliding motility-associated-like protein, partial [Crocinitomix sp.]